MTLGQILERLAVRSHQEFGARTFESRLRTQKAIYLLKVFGYPPVQHYNFTNYFHGPYCPELTAEYYAVQQGEVEEGPTPPEIPAQSMGALLDALGRGNQFLEAVTTLHSIQRRNRLDQTRALETVRVMKPHLEQRTLHEAWEYLRQHTLLI